MDTITLQFSTARPSSLLPFSAGWKNRVSKIIRMLGHSYFSHVDGVVDIETVAEWLRQDTRPLPLSLREYQSEWSVDKLRARYGDYALLGASYDPTGPVIVGNPRGVAIRPHDYMSFGIRRRITLQTDKADAVLAFAHGQIGKPFDTGALNPKVFLSDPFYGDVEARDWRNPDWWFCAEMWTCSLEEGRFWDEKLPIKKNRITPADLHMILMMDSRVVDRHMMMWPIPFIKMGRHEI